MKTLYSIKQSIPIVLFTLLAFPVIADNKQQRVPGAGPSTVIVTKFFSLFEKTKDADGYSFMVPQRSVKHAGGIKASSHYLFGRTGRPLNPNETIGGKFEIPLARIPLVFVTGKAVPAQTLTKSELQAIYQRDKTVWTLPSGEKMKITLAGREPTEAVLTELIKTFDFIDNIHFDIIFKRDHQLVNYLETEAGQYAISFGAKQNLVNFNQVAIEGTKIDIPVGLVVDKSRRNHPIVKAVQNFVQTKKWKTEVKQMGLVPL